MMRSRRSRNAIPIINPMAAGANANLPICSDMSMAGISKDHTEAATMTPAANPRSAFWITGFSSFFINRTHAAPAVVPIKGMIKPQNIVIFITSFLITFLLIIPYPSLRVQGGNSILGIHKTQNRGPGAF